MDKKLYIIAGVNGAGKSTFYLRKGFNKNIEKSIRINTDEIVRSFGDWKNELDQLKAAKIAVKLRNDCFEKNRSFNEETTLCGKTIMKQIEKAKKKKYEIYLYYIGVNSPEISKIRVKNRVLKGGHGIPEKIIEKRYYESIKNLKDVIKDCDYIEIYDNSENFKLCYKATKNKNYKYVTNELPKWVKNILVEIKKE